MLGEQRLQVAGAFGDPRRRHADVLDDQRRARQAQLADQAVEALADPPGELDLLQLAGEGDAAGSSRGRRAARSARATWASSSASSSPPNSTSSAARGRVELFPLLRRADHVPGGGDQRRGDHQLDRGGAAATRSPTGATARVDAGEVDPGGRRQRRLRDRLEDDLGDVGERPLRADQEAAEDLQRLVGVEEGAEAVPGRVLDLELAADPGGQLGVGADLVADRREARGELRLGRLELGGGARRGGVDPRPRGEDEGQRAHRRVGVLGHPAAHPARVVGDDAADRGDVGARRVGAEPRPCGARTRLAWPRIVPVPIRTAAPSSSTASPRKWRRTSTRMPSVCPWPLRLVPPARKVTGIAAARGRRRGPWRRRRASSPSPRRAAAAGRGWRRRRSGRGRRDGRGRGRRRAAPRVRRAAAGRCRRRPSRGRGPGTGTGRRASARRGRGRAASGGRAPSLEERHPGRDRDFDQLRLRGGERRRERARDPVAVGRPVGGDAVALGDRGDVELRQVEARARRSPARLRRTT